MKLFSLFECSASVGESKMRSDLRRPRSKAYSRGVVVCECFFAWVCGIVLGIMVLFSRSTSEPRLSRG